MNQRKIDFIVAYNHERYFEECRFYISQLTIPEGYEAGLLGIGDARSMTSAYNEGMGASEAKYKVYLHQDVFIFNKNFIADVLELFQSDGTIGMIGVLGGNGLPEDGIFYTAWNIGRVKADNAISVMEINFQRGEGEKYYPVEAIDGMIMVTQYDLPWREDLFPGWDFYDASQSFEFRNKGYRIVVPGQKEAWCLHDCGPSKLKDYDESRSIFVREYINKDEGTDILQQRVSNGERDKSLANIRNHIEVLYGKGELSAISDILQNVEIVNLWNTELRAMIYVFEIYDVERSDPEKDYVMFTDHYPDWPQTYALYQEVRFLVRRIEQGYTGEEYVGALVDMYREKRISRWALLLIIRVVVMDWKRVAAFFNLPT